ncbi:ComF family protein [Luteolibacter flavescens]|uniref:ComF family protein n=1 Tax=Luteolibacter flavescens TaxID=1859460 RepID=A0ABT3FRK2_9BACT|nr:ComF family protein [Luteolibacter flavescens]MCW1886172.1 ComF family protein [Luteolibacter flavescens]
MGTPHIVSSAAWRGWGRRVLDMVYPGRCHHCAAGLPAGRSLCDACAAELPSLREPFCLKCGEEFEGHAASLDDCPNCRGEKLAFDFARPALPHHPRLLEMIHGLKYGRHIELGEELARLAARSFQDDPRLSPALAERWPLVPVPLHRRRLLWRHFNQAEEIARPLAALTGLPMCRAIARTRPTDSQTSLTRAQRLQNLRGAFDLSREGGRSLAAGVPSGAIIVDDVFTTGATTSECARVLRKAGIQKVVVVTVMRG